LNNILPPSAQPKK